MKLTFIKFLITFIVGFTSRVIVNYLYDINVFTDYTNNISIAYYSFLSILIIYINDINFSFINPLLISFWDGLCCILSLKWLPLDKLALFAYNFEGLYMGVNPSYTPDKEDKLSNVLFADGERRSKHHSGRHHSGSRKFTTKGAPSAAIEGLYGPKSVRGATSAGVVGLYSNDGGVERNYNANHVNGVNENRSTSFSIRSRIYWYGIQQYGSSFNSYREFSNALSDDFRLRSQLKEDISYIWSRIRNKDR